jgi:cyclopropane-fatty-acyl-phospholipid synthase
MTAESQKIVSEWFANAGIEVNGSNPWDITIHHPKTYSRILSDGSLGLGESYVEGWWDCQQIDQFIFLLLRYGMNGTCKWDYKRNPVGIKSLINYLHSRLFNLQSVKRAFHIGEYHYDLGDDLFIAMLDSQLNYSCGYWKNCVTLEQAQQEKLKLVCSKLELAPGMKVLDIGCGWGAFAKYAAQHYDVTVDGYTISQKQYQYAKQNCANLPVAIHFADYRTIHDKYDRICSIGMFEHVGIKNYQTYMEIVARNLVGDGLFLLHTIGSNISTYDNDPWIEKYIFPNSKLPSAAQICSQAELQFVLEDWHNFGNHYDNTLLAWRENFIKQWDPLSKHYDSRFYRLWNYYLCSCAGSFRARYIQLWQIVFSKGGRLQGYHSIR